MNYQIIGDSCMDETEKMQQDTAHFSTVPLQLIVGQKEFCDDNSFDQSAFLELIRTSPECPRTACPSPDAFCRAFEASTASCIFVVTLSDKLSGTYNAACLGQKLYEETHGESAKKIAVINSFSGCAGETRIALLIRDLCESGKSFEETVQLASDYAANHLQTYFVLQTLDTLRKNGRLSGPAALFAYVLNLKPVLFAEGGEIKKYDTARGINKALRTMCEAAVRAASDAKKKSSLLQTSLARPEDASSQISGKSGADSAPLPQLDRAVLVHCNCPERAAAVRDMLKDCAVFAHIDIAPTRGVSTIYAADGGIVLAI